MVEIKHRRTGEVILRLEGDTLQGAGLARAKLGGACLRGNNLEGADLSGADLSSACLTGANLRLANLRGAKLDQADLSGADLSAADLEDASLEGANLTQTLLTDTILSHIHYSSDTRWAPCCQPEGAKHRRPLRLSAAKLGARALGLALITFGVLLAIQGVCKHLYAADAVVAPCTAAGISMAALGGAFVVAQRMVKI